MDLEVELLAAGSASILSYHMTSIHGKWHMYGTSLLKISMALFAAFAVFEAAYQGLPFSVFALGDLETNFSMIQ